jgi:hypothetical protein
MLVLHETHSVIGLREDEFEAAYRDEYAPALGADGDARLLHFLHHAHGSGAAYTVVTLTAFPDAAAYDRLRQRIERGDLQKWAVMVDDLRHDVHGKFLVPLPWSVTQEIDLATVPTTGVDHDPAIYMEDTVWPHEGRLEDYVERAGSHYAAWMASTQHAPEAMLRIEAAYRTAFGSGRRREIVLTQRITKPERVFQLLTTEMAPEHKRPGTWMHDGLEFRDQWQSRLLRSTRWSPLP